MELKTLRSFVAVATLKNFSAAARELNTVQPAVSRHVSDLEDELGVQLLWRNTREVKVTPAGQSLLVDAKEILAAEIAAKESAKLAASGLTGRLRIGYLPPACFCFIPDLVRSYSNYQCLPKRKICSDDFQSTIIYADGSNPGCGRSRGINYARMCEKNVHPGVCVYTYKNTKTVHSHPVTLPVRANTANR